MKGSLLLLALLSGLLPVFAAGPRIVDGSVSIAKDEHENKYKITYRIEDAPGIVTVDIFTNDVSVGAACVVAGDVNKIVHPGGETPMEIWWTPVSAPGGFVLSEEDDLTVKVTVWKKEAPPDYLAVRLDYSDDIFRYYTSSNTVPGGVGSDLYKTDVMLFRKVHAAGVIYSMGSPSAEATAAGKTNETQHDVLLTNDYYVSVFPMTRAQYKRIKYQEMYTRGSDDFNPMICSYNTIRGSVSGAKWPESDDVDSSSVVGALRDRTGMRFDLLTEGEWEYACRAGTSTALNNGKNLSNQTGQDEAADEVAFYKFNSGSVLRPVGCHAPNAWGIYDMHGCLYEWCLDWYEADLGKSFVTNPAGPASSATGGRTLRGGYYKSEPKEIRSAFRMYKDPKENHNTTGVRLKCLLPEAVYSGVDSEISDVKNYIVGFKKTGAVVFAGDEESPFISVVCRKKDSSGTNFISKPVGIVILFR